MKITYNQQESSGKFSQKDTEELGPNPGLHLGTKFPPLLVSSHSQWCTTIQTFANWWAQLLFWRLSDKLTYFWLCITTLAIINYYDTLFILQSKLRYFKTHITIAKPLHWAFAEGKIVVKWSSGIFLSGYLFQKVTQSADSAIYLDLRFNVWYWDVCLCQTVI